MKKKFDKKISLNKIKITKLNDFEKRVIIGATGECGEGELQSGGQVSC